MLGYIDNAGKKCWHEMPITPQHSSYLSAPIKYSAKVQNLIVEESLPLSPEQILRIQGNVGQILYYSRAIEPILVASLSAIGARQAKGTKAAKEACQHLLDYCATHPNAVLHYHVSNMILAIHTDESYLS